MKSEINIKSAIYYRAAEIVERGWCQHVMSTHGKYCAVGAIRVACSEIDMDTVTIAGRTSLFQLGLSRDTEEELMTWNDDPERTVEEVAAHLRMRGDNAGLMEKLKNA